MDKIKDLVSDITNCYVELGDRKVYLCPFSKRKELTNDTTALNVGQLAAKVQEVIEGLNAVIEKINN